MVHFLSTAQLPPTGKIPFIGKIAALARFDGIEPAAVFRQHQAGAVRRILDGQADDDAETQALFAGAFTGDDFKEGVAAFLEKRKAVFK